MRRRWTLTLSERRIERERMRNQSSRLGDGDFARFIVNFRRLRCDSFVVWKLRRLAIDVDAPRRWRRKSQHRVSVKRFDRDASDVEVKKLSKDSSSSGSSFIGSSLYV